MSGHHFVFSRDFDGPDRVCGECRTTYDHGEHILIDRLKPYTSYVCPSGGGLGHSSTWTGAYRPVSRTLRDHLCACGTEFVEEDKETWRLTWEMRLPEDGEWRPVEAIRSKHAAEQQRDGLLTLIDQGEPIRNVRLTRLVEVTR